MPLRCSYLGSLQHICHRDGLSVKVFTLHIASLRFHPSPIRDDPAPPDVTLKQLIQNKQLYEWSIIPFIGVLLYIEIKAGAREKAWR